VYEYIVQVYKNITKYRTTVVCIYSFDELIIFRKTSETDTFDDFFNGEGNKFKNLLSFRITVQYNTPAVYLMTRISLKRSLEIFSL
jgi:hypothetical protein